MSLAINGGSPVRRNPLEFKPWIEEEDIKLVGDIIRSGNLSSLHGKYNAQLEEELAKYLGVGHAFTASNGTSSIHLALKAIGVGPGDEVVTTPFTFVATASTILHSNAVPIFADIDRETLNLDPMSVESVISDKTKAILVVHLAGYPAEMDEFMRIARERGIHVIEDTAQSLGAEYRGRKAGGIAHASTHSFYPTKTITTGEGGAVATNDSSIASQVKLLRSHGETEKYHYDVLGYNYRLTEFQAALGLMQLRRIEKIVENKARYAKALTEELSDLDNDALILPHPKPHVRHAWHIYQMLLSDKVHINRDKLVDAVRAEGIKAVTVAYPVPLYRTRLFQEMRGHGMGCPWSCPFYGKKVEYKPLPNAEWASSHIFGILVSPFFTEADAVDTAKAIKKAIKGLS
ncbi:MAG: DegT/DnrJ/EryC1/StrS family aminotransferase [Thermocladium sp.]|jgi:dTDP-4-amino-4,6-dideoxygalactose transaminase|nr:MAG: DegT/DnrJ/EryC1/StrS aminotransferase [Thermocladium sp. ECH_B]